MIIYNVTVKVDHRIAEKWLTWLQVEHIPDVLSTGCFTKATILKLMEVDETEGLTYAIQYAAESKALYNRYISEFSDDMRMRGFRIWGDRFIAFRSVMQVVN